MSVDTSAEAALRICRFVVIQVDYRGTVTDFIGPQPVRLTETLDSVGLLELASFVEDSFGVQIEDDEIVPENFGTVADLVRLLCDKGALAAPSAADGEDRKGIRS
jgi:hypothetical protein